MRRLATVVSIVVAVLSLTATAFADDPTVVRYEGADRYATAAAVSQADFPSPGAVDVVFVAVGTNFPDGLSGAAAAARFGAPVLLVRPTSIPAATAAELVRLDPDLIVVVGGTSAISSGVQAQLGAYAPQVIRLGGSDRYGTSAAVSAYAFPAGADEVVVVTGAQFPDALTGAGAAAMLDGPVLLTRPDTLPAIVRDEIIRLDPARITVVGGPAAIGPAVFGSLAALAPTAIRVSGADRYATAAAVAEHAFSAPIAWAYVAVGTEFPDALVGGAGAASRQAPVLLTRTDSLPLATRTALRDLEPNQVALLGGPVAIGLVPEHRIAHLGLPNLAEIQIGLVEVADGFASPLFVASRPGDSRLFVVERAGRIISMDTIGANRVTVLDISSKVRCCGERGLLGIAFDPANPDRLFVHYTAEPGGATTVEEHDFPVAAAVANPAPVGTVLAVAQPFSNHNGGMIAFGPDGLLYIALGDGGDGGDPLGHGQDPSTRLGTILRLDVSSLPATIPVDNPFAFGTSGDPAVWVYGLRNPWRFSFDGDDLYIGDVGQSQREEVDLIDIGSGGANLGWNVMEGTLCYAGPASLCADNDFVDPIHEYSISGPRCAITGGYVYRGAAFPELVSAYLFGDFCTGELMALRTYKGTLVDHRVFPVTAPSLSSFGVGEDGTLYVTSLGGGRVYRVVASG